MDKDSERRRKFLRKLMRNGVTEYCPNRCDRPHIVRLRHHKRCLLHDACKIHAGCGKRWTVNFRKYSGRVPANWWKCPNGCHDKIR